MPQPSGQVLLDTASPYYGYLYYANGAGLWDARNGAMLAKTGSGSVFSEGGVSLIDSTGGAGSTYFTLPAKLTLSGAYTIIWRARKNSGATDSAGIIFGSLSDSGNYVWMRTSEIRQSAQVLATNTNVGTLSTYMLVRAANGLSRKLYKDGVLVNENTASANALIINEIMWGLSPLTTYGFNGDLEFMRIIPGLIPDTTQITGLFSDPYQGLVLGADSTAPVLSAATASATAATTATGSVTTDEAGPSWAVLTASATTPTAAQIKAGQDQAGGAAPSAATAALALGANASAFAFSGLAAGGTYYLHVTQDDTASPANTAAPITSASFTTPAPDTTLPVLTGLITLVSKTQTSISVSCPAGSDNVAVVAYEWSRDSGSTWADDGTTRNFTGLTASTEYGIRVRARDSSGNVSTPALALSVTTDAPPSGTITVTSPAPYRMRQRNVATGLASVTIAGNSTAATIEYRRGSDAWQTLVAGHAGGAYSATVTMGTGQGDLQVRHASDTAVTATVPLSTTGDAFILMGQSNNVGVSPQFVPPAPGVFTALQYDRNDVWKPLQEGDTQATSFDGGSAGSKGSYVGALSNRLQANGVPVAFVPSAVGSTRIEQWERYAPLPTALSTLYGRALTQWNEMGGGRAAIFWQGESDATNGTTKADYKARLHGVIDGWWADTGTPTFLILITNFHAGAPLIREAQMEVIAENPHVIGWADGGGAYSGDVHYLTSAQINAVADAVYTPFYGAFYAGTVTASIAATGAVAYSGTVSMSADVLPVLPGTVTASIAASGGVVYGGTVAMSVDVLALPPGTVTASIAALGAVSYSGTVSMSATVMPMLPVVQASIAALGGVVYAGTVSMWVGDGATVWPTGRCGDSHVAVVPWVRARYAVEPGDVLSTPLRLYRVAPGGTAVLVIDYAIMYLASAADAPGRLLSVDADAGLAAVPTPAVGADVPSGVVALAVPAPAPGDYVVRATLGTVGGRTKPAALQVQALAEVPIVKVFPLDQGAVEVFEIDFAAQYLPGHSDTATELAAFDASAGIAVQSEVPAGSPLPSGVVRFRVTAPAVEGDYSVTTALRTAAGRVEPVRVVLRVNPLDVVP